MHEHTHGIELGLLDPMHGTSFLPADLHTCMHTRRRSLANADHGRSFDAALSLYL